MKKYITISLGILLLLTTSLVAQQTDSLEIGSREEAIKEAVKHATIDDTIAVLGKGHETTQEIAGQTIEFDDAKHLQLALKEKFGN